MIAESKNRNTSGNLLRLVLLDYLRASSVAGWPGTDGLTGDDIVNCYPQAISAGEAPGWQELQIRFPELAGELQALRSAKGWLEPFPSSPAASADKPEPEVNCRLSRWLVSFASGSGWYPVGEFIAVDMAGVDT
jgi:hypothetical protein